MDTTRIWIGLAHVTPRSTNRLLGGAAGAFVPAVALAVDELEFAAAVTRLLNAYDFDVVAVEDIELLSERRKHSIVEAPVVSLAHNLTLENPVSLSDFEAYESGLS